MIYEHFQVTGAHDTVLDYADLFSVTLHDDNIREFGTRWDEFLLSMSKIPSDDILESLYKLRIREFVRDGCQARHQHLVQYPHNGSLASSTQADLVVPTVPDSRDAVQVDTGGEAEFIDEQQDSQRRMLTEDQKSNPMRP